jgi:7-cyano-7-deazaguanine synthase
MDSAALLYHHLYKQQDSVRAISFNYGQRHGIELEFAAELCEFVGVPHEVVNMTFLKHLLPGSSQTDDSVAVPSGHYSEESMKATVVPNRNMIMLAIASGHALAHGIEQVSYAAHAGDHAIYPDCRPEFIGALNGALALCDWKQVRVRTPFVDMTKSEILKAGNVLGVPYKGTYSCYKGKRLHCGVCGTCIERREAFHLAGLQDPTEYDPAAPDTELLVASGWKL